LLASIHAPRIQDIVDWRLASEDGYQFGAVNTVVNAFHYAALVRMRSIAVALRRFDDVLISSKEADRLRKSFQAAFFDSQRGIYRDGEGIQHCRAPRET